MRTGRMDRVVTLRGKTTAPNDYGEEVATWSDIATVWAERLELRGDERWNAQQVVAKIACKYRIRYRTDVDAIDILVDSDGREYDIQAVLEIGRREGLELICSARGE